MLLLKNSGPAEKSSREPHRMNGINSEKWCEFVMQLYNRHSDDASLVPRWSEAQDAEPDTDPEGECLGPRWLSECVIKRVVARMRLNGALGPKWYPRIGIQSK